MVTGDRYCFIRPEDQKQFVERLDRLRILLLKVIAEGKVPMKNVPVIRDSSLFFPIEGGYYIAFVPGNFGVVESLSDKERAVVLDVGVAFFTRIEHIANEIGRFLKSVLYIYLEHYPALASVRAALHQGEGIQLRTKRGQTLTFLPESEYRSSDEPNVLKFSGQCFEDDGTWLPQEYIHTSLAVYLEGKFYAVLILD